MKTKMLQMSLVAGLLMSLPVQRVAAQIFPAQGDDTTSSMGVFRVTINPAFYSLVAPAGALVAYPGYNGVAGKLTSPLCIDNATTIGRSGRNTVPYPAAFPVAIGAGSWDTILGYGDYAAIPALWSGAPVNTEEVLTEIKSFNLMSVSSSAGQQCPPDPRIPTVPLAWPMVKAGTFAGVAPRSLGIVDENVPNGVANPDFPAHSFFDVFVEVNLPPIAGTVSSTAFPGGGAVLYNDLPLIITNLNLTSFPPQVVYIHGITPAVPLKFRNGNAPYWNAGDVFGYLVLAGHGTITNDCNNGAAVQGILNAVLGTVGTSKQEAPIEWPRTNRLCPTPGTTYNSAQGTNADGTSVDEVKFGSIHVRNFVHSGFPNPINPPTPGNRATYTAPATQVNFDYSFDGSNWNSSVATGPLATTITNVSGTGSTTSTYNTEMTNLTLTAGTLKMRESPTLHSLGQHTIRTNGGVYLVSSFFDVFLDLSLDNGTTWIPADRAIRVQPSPTPPPPAAQVPEFFNPQPVLPPTNSVYVSPALWHVLYAQGIVIRDVRHRFFTQNYPLPALGTSQLETFSSELDYDLSTDNGATFHSATSTANVTVQVTHTQDVGTTKFFSTEMLALNLTSGTLMIRESPTLQSTGQTTVRTVPGGYMISSFFDIFTELSTDGGLSWQPANSSGHVEMRPDTKTVVPASQPTRLQPAPGGAYVSPQQWHALFAQGIVIKDVSHKFFTGGSQPPTPGSTSGHTFDSQLDLQVSTDSGSTYQSVRAAAPVTVTMTSQGSIANPLIDTEMNELRVTLPSGIMIRESPTEPSRGQTEMIVQPDGTYMISSFFDIFTELSLDGGATWSATTNGPVRMQLTTPAVEVVKPTSNLPPPGGAYVSPAQWHALYANGIIITNASHDRFLQTQPPPTNGATATENFGSTVSGQISMNGGASFQSFSAPASVSVQVGSRADLDIGTTRFFDTEMLSLNLSGGNLPGSVMIRESPSKQSLGRTSVRTDTGGYKVSSFFDVFTEVSLDGGATWSPSITKPVTMGLQTNTPVGCIVTISCPSSITVTSVGPAVVSFTVTANDTCSNPLTVTCTPPSGSVFPVGTTTVTCTASNADGTANCSFTVTVKPKPRVFPNGGKLPPTNSVYISPAMWHAAYANGIYISNVIHRAFTANYPPPTNGTSTNETFGSKVDFMMSPGGGLPFQKYTGNAACTVHVTSIGSQGNDQVYQTEMLQLDLSGGTIPAGVMIRESPTKQSTGETRITPTGTGTYQISSFFDIWTDLSTDGGATWLPSSSAGHMELHIDSANPPTILTQPQRTGTQLNFNLPTQPGLRYTVQYTGDLRSQTWNTLTVVAGNGQSLMVNDPAANSPQRFYRVVIDEDPNQ